MVISAITLAVPLLSYAAVGFHTRYMADDYCTAALLYKGFWGAARHLYENWTGKYAYAFVVGLFGLAGPRIVRFLPAAALTGWLTVMVWALWQVCVLARMRRPGVTASGLGVLLLFVTVDRTPDYIQSLYWQTGLVAYTAPLILLTAYAGFFALWCRRSPQIRYPVLWLGVSLGLTFLAGGFAETYAVVQTGALFMAIGGAMAVVSRSTRRTILPPLIAGLVGSLLALVASLSAPGNSVRMTYLPPHPDIIPFLADSIYHALRYVGYWMLLPPFTMLLALVAPAALLRGMQASDPSPGSDTTTDWAVVLGGMSHTRRLRLAAMIALVGFVLVVASVVPGVWGYGSPPDRVYVVPSFIIACVGMFCGVILRYAPQETPAPGISAARWRAGLLVAALALSPLYSLLRPLSFLPRARTYAERWDARDRHIREAVRLGAKTLTVPALDTIAGLNDVAPDPPQNWVNRCIADYYGLESISPMTKGK